MTNSTHRAFLVLDLYAVDDEQAREIVDLAAASVGPLMGVMTIEASPPTRRPAVDDGAKPDVRLSHEDAAAAGALVRAYLRTHDAMLELGHVSVALPHRNKLEQLADLLDGGQELEALALPDPHAGEVYPLHRGSRA